MADEPQASAISSAFPAPPPYYKDFDSDKIELLRQELSQSSPLDLTAYYTSPVSSQHTYTQETAPLQPPSIPVDGRYTLFGDVHQVQSDNQKVSFDLPDPPSQSLIIANLHQILLKFLRIVHILSLDPSMKYYGPAWDQLDALYTSIHNSLNQWRPHQSRETLIRMMESQVAQVRSETAQIKVLVAEAHEKVTRLASTNTAELNPSSDKTDSQSLASLTPETAPKPSQLLAQERIWKAIAEDS